VSGDTAVGHALAHCLAVEEALGLRAPARAGRARAMLLELERLHNHVSDLGALCNDVGHGILHAHAWRVRERLLRLNHAVTGHRLLRGGVVLGGAVLRALPEPAELAAVRADVRSLVELALGHPTIRDRFTGTAILPLQAARDLGCLGYVARASGLATDARHAHPLHDPDDPDGPGDLPVTRVLEAGDVLARFTIRAQEAEDALDLITRLAGTLAPGAAVDPTPHVPARRSGVGIAEGWRGTITTRVELAPDGTFTRVKVVDPSFFNWPALPVALADTIVPDFPLTNKSFNLSYAGNDL
ncbi:formate hydrogenase, partial [Kitasatospora sp. NPDC093558]